MMAVQSGQAPGRVSPAVRVVLVTVVAVALAAGLLSLLFKGPGDAAAVWTSAAVALGVQLLAFALGARVGGKQNVVAKMGTGFLVRFLALVVYAVLVATVLKLPLVAALVSIAALFFLTTIIEPLI
jgi:hypothetical protein